MAILLDEKPIFMIGVERSGTTLVMAMLGCHPRIAVPEVVWYYSRFRPYLFTFGDLSDDDSFRTLASEMVFGLKTPFWGMKVNVRTIVDEILFEVRERSSHRVTADITFLAAGGTVVARMEGYAWTVDPSLREAFGREQSPHAARS